MRPLATVIGLLLLLTGCAQGDASAPTTAAPMTGGIFEDASARTGLAFTHFNGATGEYYLPEIMGSGAALFDYDDDGDLDVYLAQGDFIDAGKSMRDATFPLSPGHPVGGRLFRNEIVPRGTLAFIDVTDAAGIATRFDGMGAAVGDYDNNGTLDLLATGVGRNALLRNGGSGTFTDVTRDMGVTDPNLSTSAAFFDYDRDGWLDLFVVHYVSGTTVERKKCRNPAAELDYCGPAAFPPSVSRLYHNQHGTRFTDVTTASGVGVAAGPGLGVVIADVDTDGWPDIYVANDGAASFLWMNQQDGTFRERGLEMGVAYSSDGKAQAGMGIALGDVDNDGHEEIVKTNLRGEGANLYRKGDSGVYGDVASRVNLLGPTVAHTGFGVGTADFDNDGWLDVFMANGAVMAMEKQHGDPYPYRQPNVLLQNVAGAFHPVQATSGPLADEAISRGVAFGDVDNDGDVDGVLATNNGPARLLLNTTSARGLASAHWLRVRLASRKAGLRGYQAVVRVKTASGRTQMRRVDPGGSYLSASDAAAHIGLGPDTRVTALSVEWPDGSTSTHPVDSVDREIRISQP